MSKYSEGSEEFKESSIKSPLSKFEYDLYHEEDDITLPVFRVKHFNLPNKNERWKIFQDNKIILIVDGMKLNKKERSFLHTTDGVIFLINQCRAGIKSFNALKIEIKKKMKSLTKK